MVGPDACIDAITTRADYSRKNMTYTHAHAHHLVYKSRMHAYDTIHTHAYLPRFACLGLLPQDEILVAPLSSHGRPSLVLTPRGTGSNPQLSVVAAHTLDVKINASFRLVSHPILKRKRVGRGEGGLDQCIERGAVGGRGEQLMLAAYREESTVGQRDSADREESKSSGSLPPMELGTAVYGVPG